MNDWIPVLETLPPIGEEVFLWINGHRSPSFTNNYPAVGYLWYDGTFLTYDNEVLIGITHWKKITAPNLKRETK